MQLTQWMRRYWDERRNRRERRAAESRTRHCAGEYVSLRLTRLDDRRVFSVASVTAGPDASVSEGANYSLPSSTYTDATAPSSPHTAEVDWGDGSAVEALTVSSEPAVLGGNGTVAGATHAFRDNGVYNVVVTVRGNDGTFQSDTVVVTVNNVNPTANAGGPYRVGFSDTVQLSGSASTRGSTTRLPTSGI
ncbi:MAG: PKD domain-containing protein [Pirellulales bacterium]